MQVIVIEGAVVKGYHDFKIRPPVTNPATELIVDREYTNIKDVNACLVWIPALNTFPPRLHDTVTDDKRHLQLRDVASLPIGHVPRGLAGAFRQIMDLRNSKMCQAVGDPVPSFSPWPAPHQNGGGVVIPCKYIINCQNSDNNKIRRILPAAILAMPENEVLNVL
jgi:hypothetical protein